jgi:hypothetical protein
MTDPITPPPELLQQWYMDATGPLYEKEIATRAAQWGADQELEACCEWLDKSTVGMAELLRAARRPKPPSLKEQALARTAAILNDPNRALLIEVRETLELIRRALEALPE